MRRRQIAPLGTSWQMSAMFTAVVCRCRPPREKIVERREMSVTDGVFSLVVLIMFMLVPVSAYAGAWSATGFMGTGRSERHIAAVLADGKVLFAGGDYPGRSAEIFDPSLGLFLPTGSMTTARNNLTVTSLKDGRVLVAGGFPNSSSAEIYQPTTGTFSSTGAMSGGSPGPRRGALARRQGPDHWGIRMLLHNA